MDGLVRAISDARARLDGAEGLVGECGAELRRMGLALTDSHRDVLERYYIDRYPTWSQVAADVGVSYRRVCQLRTESYGWLDEHSPVARQQR